jgi:hypothetical protein
MKAFWTCLSTAAALWAQSTLAPPQVGFIQDRHQTVRLVNGVGGNFLVGGEVANGIVSAAFSGSFGMLKADSAIIVTDRLGHGLASVDAPPGSAVFAFSADGSPALAYFLHTNTLMRWNGRTFQPARLQTTSIAALDVLSIAAPNAGLAVLIVERKDGLWELRVRTATGEVESQVSLPGIRGPVLMLVSGDLFFTDAKGVAIRRQDGAEKHIAAQLPKSFVLQQMGQGWIELSDLETGRMFAIRTTPGREQYYALPEGR